MRPFANPKGLRLLNILVIGLWTAVLLGISIRVALFSHSHDVFGTYADAGRRWTASQPLYTYTRGFVYSPLVAAFFAPLLATLAVIGIVYGALVAMVQPDLKKLVAYSSVSVTSAPSAWPRFNPSA